MCQLRHLDGIEYRNSWLNDKFQYYIRKFRYWRKIILRNIYPVNKHPYFSASAYQEIREGDLVRVRSRDEIRSTLNRLNKTRGCTFQTEMYDHCLKEY